MGIKGQQAYKSKHIKAIDNRVNNYCNNYKGAKAKKQGSISIKRSANVIEAN